MSKKCVLIINSHPAELRYFITAKGESRAVMLPTFKWWVVDTILEIVINWETSANN